MHERGRETEQSSPEMNVGLKMGKRERERGQRTESRRRDARQWSNPESGWEKLARDGALERDCGCLTDRRDAGGWKTFKSRTQRNQLMYRNLGVPAQIRSQSQTELMLWSASGDYLSLSLGKSHENVSQSYFSHIKKIRNYIFPKKNEVYFCTVKISGIIFLLHLSTFSL